MIRKTINTVNHGLFLYGVFLDDMSEALEKFSEGSDFEGNAYTLGFIDAVSLIWYDLQKMKNEPKALDQFEDFVKRIHISLVKRRYNKIHDFIEEGLLI